MSGIPGEYEALRDRWSEAWPAALEAWSKFTRLRPPQLCLTFKEAKDEGLTESFAMIRLTDQAIVVSLPEVGQKGVGNYAVEVLAHEIGHHILAPATLTDHARCIARIRWALPTLHMHAPMVANLYTDLLINDRLQRSAGLRIADVYRKLSEDAKGQATTSVWCLYLRIYEVLWSLERGSLGGGATDDRMEGDAWLGARLIRSYARDWLEGAGRFAALLLPHLMEDRDQKREFTPWTDTLNAGSGSEPSGLTEEDPNERTGAIHPAADPTLYGEGEGREDLDPVHGVSRTPAEATANLPSIGQARQPFEYGEILRAAGIVLTDHDIAVRYYRERALPHLVPFPSRVSPKGTDPLPEGLEPWDIGHPLDNVDWLQSVLISPNVIPGLTTVQRLWGTSEGAQPKRVPFDLDLYVDSSGSMPNPQHLISYPALAGAILCLSALRAGARVQATLWSGKNDVTTTGEFVRHEEALLRVLTGHYGGGTQFPIHVLRETYATRREDERPAHVLIVSDDGVTTIFDDDEQGSSGWKVAARALKLARGGGTMALNLPPNWEAQAKPRGSAKAPNTYYDPAQCYTDLIRARDEQGWNIHRVTTLDDLVAFAREFSRQNYSWKEETSRTAAAV